MCKVYLDNLVNEECYQNMVVQLVQVVQCDEVSVRDKVSVVQNTGYGNSG